MFSSCIYLMFLCDFQAVYMVLQRFRNVFSHVTVMMLLSSVTGQQEIVLGLDVKMDLQQDISGQDQGAE